MKGLKCRSVAVLKRRKRGKMDILGKSCQTFPAKRMRGARAKVRPVRKLLGAYVRTGGGVRHRKGSGAPRPLRGGKALIAELEEMGG